MMPLFLFSGILLPVAQLPVALRYLAYAMPLWHGAVLSRDFYAGHVNVLADLGHAAYLAVVAAAGAVVARTTFARRLAR